MKIYKSNFANSKYTHMFYDSYHVHNHTRVSLFNEYTVIEIEAEKLFTSKEVFDTFYNVQKENAIYADKYPDAIKSFEFEVYSYPDVYHKGRIETHDVKFLVVLPFKATEKTFIKYRFRIVHMEMILHEKEGHCYLDITEEKNKNIRVNLDFNLDGLPGLDAPIHFGKNIDLNQRLNEMMMMREEIEELNPSKLQTSFFNFKDAIDHLNNRHTNLVELSDEPDEELDDIYKLYL